MDGQLGADINDIVHAWGGGGGKIEDKHQIYMQLSNAMNQFIID